jgi:hypothetical protein
VLIEFSGDGRLQVCEAQVCAAWPDRVKCGTTVTLFNQGLIQVLGAAVSAGTRRYNLTIEPIARRSSLVADAYQPVTF